MFNIGFITLIWVLKSFYLRSHLSLDIQTIFWDVVLWQRYCSTGGCVCSLVCNIVPTPHWSEHPFVSFFHMSNSQSSKSSLHQHIMQSLSNYGRSKYKLSRCNGSIMMIFVTRAILQSKYFSRRFLYVVLRIYFGMKVACSSYFFLDRCLIYKRMAEMIRLAHFFA